LRSRHQKLFVAWVVCRVYCRRRLLGLLLCAKCETCWGRGTTYDVLGWGGVSENGYFYPVSFVLLGTNTLFLFSLVFRLTAGSL